MGYLNFDRSLLVNLDKSLRKELLRVNRRGAYCSSSIVGCNTRKYHGLLVAPCERVGRGNYVLLSSLDETVIQYGAEFNLGVHKYYQSFSPNGYQYIMTFERDIIAKTTYRLGGVVLSKEALLVREENRILIRYKLEEAMESIKIKFRPFLAFRSVDGLCRENNALNQDYAEVENGTQMCLYPNYPALSMQFSKKVEYFHAPDWYRGVEYPKEQERGYDYAEDLFVPGYYEAMLKPQEELIFSAGISTISARSMKTLWNKEYGLRIPKNTMYDCLRSSALQFFRDEGEKCYIWAGFPWFDCYARNEFFSLPGLTLGVDDEPSFHRIVNTAKEEVERFLKTKKNEKGTIKEMDAPDALLWLVWAIQRYAIHVSAEDALARYGDFVLSIVQFIRAQEHPRLSVQNNGLVYTDGREKPASWMNAEEDGRPIVPRTGFLVEINALWYNALRYAADIAQQKELTRDAELMTCQAELCRVSFGNIFWNGVYLNDYAVDGYTDKEVRPNMIFAVSMPYSPLNAKQQKSVLDVCTRELLTPKGLRSLSPKSGCYRPEYVGGQLERNRNYHNGPVWPWTIGAYSESYLKIYKRSGVSFVERLMNGFDGSMREICIGTVSELYDGNPPFKGHGGISYAMNLAAILRVLTLLKKSNR